MVQLSVPPNPRIPFEVLHEDGDLLIVCKPAGVVTQPGVGHDRDTLLNGLFATHGKRLQNLGKRRDFGLVHRLDRPTSGLVVIALSAAGYDGMRARFAERRVEKTYLALVHGVPRPARGVERGPIREVRPRGGGRKRARVGAHPEAQAALTRYQVEARAGPVSLLRCEPRSGRLHQIRAHLAARGCAVVGDREYGPPQPLDQAFRRACPRALFLHAARLAFEHPCSGERLAVSAPLPPALLDFLTRIELVCPARWR